VTFTLLVTNAGNVPLSDVVVSDDSCDAAPAFVGGDINGDSKLDPAEIWEYSCAMVDVGTADFENVATANADDPNGDPVDTALDASLVDIINPALTIRVIAAPETYDMIGEMIQYTYLVTNTGDVAISAIAVTDDLATDESCPGGDLAPDDSLTCTAIYTITQADLDAGSVTNVAFATGRDPNTDPVTSPTDSATVEFAESYTVYLPIVYR
jgi:hypothetical protein